MPPDEFHYPVNDSVYTNVAVRIALAFAVDAGGIVRQPVGANWSAIATGLRVPLNTSGNYHPEFASYTGDTVKQADAILLGFPFLFDMPVTTRVRCGGRR